MRVFKTVLNGKGLLAASIAMLSTSALAETAGRVSFVSGVVTASLPDGSSRQPKDRKTTPQMAILPHLR